MAAVTALNEYATWTAAGHSPSVVYSRSVLDQIDTLVKDGYNRLRRGGVEVGGVLFGVRTERGVTIHAFRPLTCEYAFGPNFLLSEKDCMALDGLLAAARTDPHLQGMVPVGWYHSHTRSALHLSSQDLEIFDRHFPERWQVALVLRPGKVGPTSAGFFFREADGSIHSESSYREFPLTSDFAGPRRPAGMDFRIPIPVRRPAPTPARPSTDRKWIAYAAVSGLALVMFGYFAISGVWSRTPVPLSLTIEDRGNQIRITWDRAADAIRRAGNASLELVDGDRTTPVALDADELRTGSVLYARTSQHVVARMRVGADEASASFIGQPVAAAEVKPVEIEPPVESRQEDSREQADQLKPEPVVNTRPEQPSAVKVKEPPPKVVFKFRPPKPRSTSTPLLAAAPPIDRIAAPAAIPTIMLEKSVRVPAAPARSVPAATRVAPLATARPASGSFLWTGRISRNGTLTIDGSHPSTGAVTGAVPGFPVRVRVYPADLTSDGLKVYTEDLNRSEAPGPRNGWNQTSFVRDPKRARAVSVVEAPGEHNQWKRLVLRGEGSGASLVLVEWGAIVPKQ